MSIPTEDTNVVAALLSDVELGTLLDEAESEERRLSDRRRELHDLIDARYLVASAPEDQVELTELALREREISAERLQLHQRILDLRLEKSRRAEARSAPPRDLNS